VKRTVREAERTLGRRKECKGESKQGGKESKQGTMRSKLLHNPYCISFFRILQAFYRLQTCFDTSIWSSHSLGAFAGLTCEKTKRCRGEEESVSVSKVYERRERDKGTIRKYGKEQREKAPHAPAEKKASSRPPLKATRNYDISRKNKALGIRTSPGL